MTDASPPTAGHSESLIALSAGISKVAQIQTVRLSESSISENLGPAEQSLEFEHTFSVKHELDDAAKTISVRVLFQFRGKYVRGETEGASAGQPEPDIASPAASIDAVFFLQYSVPAIEGILEKNVSAFAKMNGVFNAWPYWREYLQSTLLRIGMPPMTLQVITGAALEKIYASKGAKQGDVVESPPATALGNPEPQRQP